MFITPYISNFLIYSGTLEVHYVKIVLCRHLESLPIVKGETSEFHVQRVTSFSTVGAGGLGGSDQDT